MIRIIRRAWQVWVAVGCCYLAACTLSPSPSTSLLEEISISAYDWYYFFSFLHPILTNATTFSLC